MKLLPSIIVVTIITTMLIFTSCDPNALSEAESIAIDKALLEIVYSGSDTANSVNADITLASTGSSGTVITWESNLVNVITAVGVVTRPAFVDGDCSVVLTATLTKGDATDTKTFNLTVLCLATTDTEAVSAAKAALDTNDIIFAAGDTATSITGNFTLPSTGANGTTITWAEVTDASSVVEISGTNGSVARPTGDGSNDASVTIRATISKGEATDKTKDLTIIISDMISIANSSNGNRLAVASDGTRYYLEGSSSYITAVHKSSDGREWTTLSSTGLPTGSGTANYGSSIAVDSNKNVYVLSKFFTDPSYFTNVYKLSDGGTSWSLVGNADFATGSGGSGTTGKIVIDADDKPIVIADTSGPLHVFELAGNVWSDISPETTQYKADVCIDGTNIYYIHGSWSGYSTVYKRTAGIWTKITSISDITGDDHKYPSITASNGIVTAAVLEGGNVKVVRWESGSWTELSSSMPVISVSNAGSYGYMQTLTIGSTSYLAAPDGTLIKYSSGSWSELSNFTSCSSAGINADYDPSTDKVVVLNSYPSSGSWFMLDVTP